MPINSQLKPELAYGFMFERTAKHLKRHFQQILRDSESGITVDQWVILYELYQDRELNQLDLAQRTFKHAPTITRLIESLDKLDLITREADEADRRKFIVRLSEKGEEKVAQLLPMVLEFRKKGWEGLKQEDMKNLDRIVKHIFQNLAAE